MARVEQTPAKAGYREPRVLHLDGTESYECPVCRYGQIEPMVLMEAYACNFCRHILEANLEQQTVHIVDGVQSMGWRWQGWRWQPIYQSAQDVTLTLWGVGLALIVFPAGIIALGGYMFPPLEDAAGVNWSIVWAGITLMAHSAMVGWLLAEHYQFPPYVLAKVWLRRSLQR